MKRKKKEKNKKEKERRTLANFLRALPLPHPTSHTRTPFSNSCFTFGSRRFIHSRAKRKKEKKNKKENGG